MQDQIPKAQRLTALGEEDPNASPAPQVLLNGAKEALGGREGPDLRYQAHTHTVQSLYIIGSRETSFSGFFNRALLSPSRSRNTAIRTR
jgi:hypothetical protein